MESEQSGTEGTKESMWGQPWEEDTGLRSSARSARSADYSGSTPDLEAANQITFDSSKQKTADTPELLHIYSTEVWSADELREGSTTSVSFPPANPPSNPPSTVSSLEALLPIGAIPIIPSSCDLSDTLLSSFTVSEFPFLDEKPAIHSPAARVALGSCLPSVATISNTNLESSNIPTASTTTAVPLASHAEPARTTASDLTVSVSTVAPSKERINLTASKTDAIGDNGGGLPKLAPMSSGSEGSAMESTLTTGSKTQPLECIPNFPSSDGNIDETKAESTNEQYCDVHETRVAVCVCRHCRCLLCHLCQTSKSWCDATRSEVHDCLSIRHGATQFRQELERAVEDRLQQVAALNDNLSKKEAAQSSLDRNVSEVSEAICTEFDSIIAVLQAEKEFRLAELKAFQFRYSKQLNASATFLKETLPQLCSSAENGKKLAGRLRSIEPETFSCSEACTTLRDSVEALEDLATPLPSFGDNVKPVGHFEYSPQQEIGKTELHSRLDSLTGTLTLFSSRGEFLRAWGEKEEKPDQAEKQEPCRTCTHRAEDQRSQEEKSILRVDKEFSTDSPQPERKSVQTVSCTTKEKGTVTDDTGSRSSEVKIEYQYRNVYAEPDEESESEEECAFGGYWLPCNYVRPPTNKEFDHRVDNSGVSLVFDAVVPEYKDGPCFTVGPGGIYESVGPSESSWLFSGWTGGICASTDGKTIFTTSGTKKLVHVFSVDSLDDELTYIDSFSVPGARNLRGICYRPEDGSLVIVDTKANKLIIMKESDGDWLHVEDVQFDEDGRNMFFNPLYVTSAGMNHFYVTDRYGLVAVEADPPRTVWEVDLEGAWTVSGDIDRVFVTHGRPNVHEDDDIPTRRVSVISTIESSGDCSRIIRTLDGPNRKAVKVCPKGDGSGQVMLVSSYS